MFNPNDYLFLADDAAQIQAAVDAAAKAGAQAVIPRRNARTGGDIWELSRAVRLYSGSDVLLDDCYLRQADGMTDNLFKSDGAREAACKPENRLHGIKIRGTGKATLDGGNHNGIYEWNWREFGIMPVANSCIHFHNVEDFTVENIHITHNRYWALTFHHCAKGRIAGIDFDVAEIHHNQDGIDLRTGCHDIVIENITGFTGDDVVALTCLDDYKGALAVAGDSPDLYNVTIRNLRAASLGGCAIVRLLNHYGFKLYNVTVEDIADTSEPGGPGRAGAAVRIGENAYCREGCPMARLGDTHDITVRNVCTRARHGVFISRTLQNAVIENVRMFGDGGCALLMREGVMRDIRVKNLTMDADCVTPDTDDSPSEKAWSRRQPPEQPVEENRVYMVYFQGADAKGLTFDGITAGKHLDGVFGGFGEAEFTACNVTAEIPLFDTADSVKAAIC